MQKYVCKFGHVTQVERDGSCSFPSCNTTTLWKVPDGNHLWGKPSKRTSKVRGYCILAGPEGLQFPATINIDHNTVSFVIEQIGIGIFDTGNQPIYWLGFRSQICDHFVQFQKLQRHIKQFVRKEMENGETSQKILHICFQGKYEEYFSNATDDPYFDASLSDWC